MDRALHPMAYEMQLVPADSICISLQILSPYGDLSHSDHCLFSQSFRFLLVVGDLCTNSCSPRHAFSFSDMATVAKPTAPGSVGTGRVSPEPMCSVGNARLLRSLVRRTASCIAPPMMRQTDVWPQCQETMAPPQRPAWGVAHLLNSIKRLFMLNKLALPILQDMATITCAHFLVCC